MYLIFWCQFRLESHGQFEMESSGQFKLELGGQYHWNFQSRIKKSHHYDEISKSPESPDKVFLDYFLFGSLSASSIFTAV